MIIWMDRHLTMIICLDRPLANDKNSIALLVWSSLIGFPTKLIAYALTMFKRTECKTILYFHQKNPKWTLWSTSLLPTLVCPRRWQAGRPAGCWAGWARPPFPTWWRPPQLPGQSTSSLTITSSSLILTSGEHFSSIFFAWSPNYNTANLFQPSQSS